MARCTSAAARGSHALVARDEAVQRAVADEAGQLLEAVLLRQLPDVVQAYGGWGRERAAWRRCSALGKADCGVRGAPGAPAGALAVAGSHRSCAAPGCEAPPPRSLCSLSCCLSSQNPSSSAFSGPGALLLPPLSAAWSMRMTSVSRALPLPLLATGVTLKWGRADRMSPLKR